MSSAAEGIALRTLFAALDRAEIRYAVMRNYAGLPDSTHGSDLDLLVSARDGERVKLVIRHAVSALNGVVIGVADSVGFFKVYAFGSVNSDTESRWWGLCIDVNVGVFYRGLSLLTSEADWPIDLHRGVPVLPSAVAGVFGVLKEALHNEQVPDRYLAAAKEATTRWVETEALLKPMGTGALSSLRALLAGANWNTCKVLKRAVWTEAWSRDKVATLRSVCSYHLSRIRRYIRPQGMVVAILGVDGAGKSTIIKAIQPVLDAATHNCVVVKHLRPTLLPPLSFLKGRKKSSGPVLQPHALAPSGMIGSVVRLSYLTLDYVLGYWLWTRVLIAKSPTIVFFDRYSYDLALDPLRFRIRLPERFTRWFVRRTPAPDIVICLYGDPAKIAARKGELSVQETKRQVDALIEFAGKNAETTLISTDGSVDEARNQVLATIMDRLRQRSVV